MVKIAIFGLTHLLNHRITRKLLNRYMLRGVWQALNCLSIHATYCVIVAIVSYNTGMVFRMAPFLNINDEQLRTHAIILTLKK